jgi:transcriptional regulator GlxA family with amidase domain
MWAAGLPRLRHWANEALRDYVLQALGSAERVIGVSTGALLLAGLGLLDRREATTHWIYSGILTKCWESIPMRLLPGGTSFGTNTIGSHRLVA